jgi:hypothetical protein
VNKGFVESFQKYCLKDLNLRKTVVTADEALSSDKDRETGNP